MQMKQLKSERVWRELNAWLKSRVIFNFLQRRSQTLVSLIIIAMFILSIIVKLEPKAFAKDTPRTVTTGQETTVRGTTVAKSINIKSVPNTQQVASITQWISHAVTGQTEPWFVCLRLSGFHSLYTAQVYAIQARYRSWTAEWRRYRPRDYPTDEGVGLVTDQELALLYTELMSRSDKHSKSYTETSTPPPCSEDIVSRHKPIENKEYVAELWLRQPSTKPNILVWRSWLFIDPHLNPQAHPREMIQNVKALVTSVAEQGSDLDILLSPEDSGSLYLTVDQPSHIWLNGVYHGQWPSVHPIKLAEGVYELKVIPLNSEEKPVTYEGLEVLAKKKTKFRVEFE